MSTLAVTIERVANVRKHPNADRLAIADVQGWTIVTQPGLQDGDLVVYFPIDSVLPTELETHVFGSDSKVKLSSGRIKTIRLRGEYSQGMIVPWSQARTWPWLNMPNFRPLGDAPAIGTDLTQALGVKKYVSPAAARAALSGTGGNTSKVPAVLQRDIPRYTDLEHLARHPDSFVVGEQVVVTEKLHGTSARYGRVRPQTRTKWQKFKAFFGIKPKHQFVYGSRNIEYTDLGVRGGAPTNIYGGVAKRLNLDNGELVQKGEIVYGEIVGPGVQKGYAYRQDQKEFYVYDVQKDGKWLSYDELGVWCAMRKLRIVPVLYVGPFFLEVVEQLTKGPSCIDSNTLVREGVVVRREGPGNRMVRKVVSKEFLMRNVEGSEDDELLDQVDPNAETAPVTLPREGDAA